MRPRWRLRQQGERTPASLAVVPTMFNNLKARTNKRWDIVQLRPGSTPGRYILWSSVDSELIPVPLRIPREFYIHMRQPKESMFRPESYSFGGVSRSLPRELPFLNLYKLAVREDAYQEMREHLIDLASDPNVDRVFELQLFGPKFHKGYHDYHDVSNRAQNVGFDSRQPDSPMTSATSRQHLSGGKGGHYVLLYHAFSATSPLHVFAPFPPIPRLSETCIDCETTTMEEVEVLTTETAVPRELGLHENKSCPVVLSSSKDDSYFPSLYSGCDKIRSASLLGRLQWVPRNELCLC
ncbi:hypothetical protein E1B28_006853 [Marasmius oreades]|uniref:DNA polymerase epsilon catalytic subunit n=1 Tax=Marasmius oreades TaxID=181124 RepID=A0A9P8ABN1_9AGAR|nr:uncharacterized protein E1B28_008464 [Marasmius oreades]XP_043012650.1 uncharacterized protein E1B28_006853 [Marasmius oreades]KAG7092088.1 hypothetical protein E1B28_008464 [Marasmius oreades]KAG7096180.1 hypothetical protein E1B28_006853 [Marasmius oreades]